MNVLHRVLGYGGLIPFVGLAMFFHYPEELVNNLLGTQTSPIEFWLKSYAALIFTFIGGIYWATSLQPSNKSLTPLLWFSIVMMLWAWIWILMPDCISAWMMALSFWLLPLIEYKWLKEELDKDFRTMRMHLSIIAGLSLLSMNI